MRICIISPNLNPGGGYGSFAFNLVYFLKKNNRFQIEVLVDKGNKIFLGEKSVLATGRFARFFINPFVVAWHARHADVIHALDGYPYGIYAWLAHVLTGKKFVITFQGTYAVEPLYASFVKRKFLAAAYRRADVITAISCYTASEVLNIIASLDIKIINHGVDFVKYRTLADMAEKEKSIFDGDYILSVGAVKARKGYHISIPAFAEVKKRFPGMRYVIVGDLDNSDYVKNLHEDIKRKNLDGSVVFLEKIKEKDLANLYLRSKLFLLPSVNVGHHFEGFGLVYLEAAAFGVPQVAAFGSGAEDAVKNDETGILVPQEDVGATAEAMIKILSSDSLKEKMSQASKAWALAHEWSRVIESYYHLYDTMR